MFLVSYIIIRYTREYLCKTQVHWTIYQYRAKQSNRWEKKFKI